ncbi:MAG: hypothetical protein AABZ60_00505 [Planctomycetota bacterium]
MPSQRRPQKSARPNSRPPSRKPEAYEEESPSRNRRAPKRETVPAMVYIAVAVGALLIVGIALMIAKGQGEDYSESLKKQQKVEKKEKEKEEIALFSLNKNKTSPSDTATTEDPLKKEETPESIFADQELEKKRQEKEAKILAEEKALKDAELAKQKEIEETKKKGEIPEHFDFLPETSIGDKAKIKTLCEQLISDNYRYSEDAKKQLIPMGIKTVPMLLNTLKEMNVQTDDGGPLGNVIAQALVELTGEDMGYEGMGTPLARETGKKKWIEWWNKERQKHEK